MIRRFKFLILIFAILAQTSLAQESITDFDSLNIEAKAVYVYDINFDREIWARNSLTQLPLASLTKLMTAYVAYNEDAADVYELCRMLVPSDNILAEDIAKRFQFTHGRPIERWMNTTDLRLPQTFFLNSSGLDISTTLAGAYGSARDSAILISTLWEKYPKLLECTTKADYADGKVLLRNTNKNVSKTVGILASKTGLTDLAGGNLAIIFDAEIGRPIIIVVLGSSEQGRFDDVDKIIDATMHVLSKS